MLLRELVSGCLDPRPDVAVLFVSEPRFEHPERDLVSVDARRESRLQLGDALLLLAHEVAEISLARELPELSSAVVAVDRGAEGKGCVELRQALVPLVDRREIVRLLEAREVEVCLLAELRVEAVAVRAERVDLTLFERLRHAGS